MTDVSYVKDLLVRPDAVRKGDFVLELTDGVQKPAQTAADYVVTPSLVDAFDRALGLVGSALKDGRSKGTYLHGSFGSGKSHFMAMLSLLLRGDEHAWAKGELHGLRGKHSFAGGKNLLELHFHMIGKDSLESALLGRYVAHVQEHHPDAPTPAVFADEALFDNARQMLDKQGAELFFKELNQGTRGASSDDWGEFGEGAWDAERFEACASSGDPKERAELFDVLTKTWFSAYTNQGAYLDLDSGLAELARHAAGLGYDGVVLFLDELILWLAHRATEREWMHDQVQKMVKLVESEHADRAIPIVSFIARQRDLSDMVGDDYAGLDAKRLRDSLKHWEGRFDTIELPDNNLPAIVEQRVLKPKDGAEAAIDAAFQTLKREAGPAWQTLLGQWDQAAFRKLYPFSPALIEALVALSSYLQRERTAIKLLMELLVDHIEDLRVGEVVRVGDLFDAMIDGTDAADGAPRARFNAARELYTHKFLPLIQHSHGTRTPERCQRERPDSRVRLGCAGCPEKACRTDNRLIKTLLIAALVPNVRSLSDLTASRLVALNHGSIKVPIKGTEAAQAAGKLRKWGSELTQVQIGKQNDPTVRVALESVDAIEILKRAAEFDSDGGRQRILRGVLYSALNLDGDIPIMPYTQKGWKSTNRGGDVVFGNVRKMHEDQLGCPEGAAFRLVIDYPFDEAEHGPHEDEAKVADLTERDAAGWTLVWLPSFLSAESKHLLGELTILETMLSSPAHVQAHTSHLPVDQQTRARTDLENLRNAKRSRLEGILEQAYGLQAPNDADLDPSQRVSQHLHLLKPGAKFTPPKPSSLATALDVYLPSLLDTRWPRHPSFSKPFTASRVATLLDRFAQLVDADNKELALPKPDLDELGGTLGELGILQVTERVARLTQGSGPLAELENKRRQRGEDTPTVAHMRGWIDESGRMGLEAGVQDLMLRCYARLYARTFVRSGQPYTPNFKTPIPGDVELEQPPLPTESQWRAALGLAGHLFGITLPGKALHADNLKALDAKVSQKLGETSAAATRLPGILASWLDAFHVGNEVPRIQTAASANDLCAALADKRGKLLVETLARFEARTSARAVGESLATGAKLLTELENPLVRSPLERLQGDLAQATGAAELLEDLQKALRQDEVNVRLAPRLKELAVAVQKLGAVKPDPVNVSPTVLGPTISKGRKVVGEAHFEGLSAGDAATRLRQLADQLEEREGLHVQGTVVLWEPET